MVTAIRPGPVRIRAAAYDMMERLASGEIVKVIQPQLRTWLRDKRYVTWTVANKGERDYSLTNLGRSVLATAIRVVS
jgi:hypothetical protein